jgi:hypothetical protein
MATALGDEMWIGGMLVRASPTSRCERGTDRLGQRRGR